MWYVRWYKWRVVLVGVEVRRVRAEAEWFAGRKQAAGYRVTLKRR